MLKKGTAKPQMRVELGSKNAYRQGLSLHKPSMINGLLADV